MQALVFGDLHGRILAMYEYAGMWAESAGHRVEVILQVGDFGVFPDPSKVDEKKLGKYEIGDYLELARERWKAPIPTYFCKGNNEDFDALRSPLLSGLTCVPDGEIIMLGSTRIAFVGGGWAPKSYSSEEGKPNHISRQAVERLMGIEFDVLICHESPGGMRLPGKHYAVGAPPLRTLIEARQPNLAIHGHHHIPAERTIGQTRVISLGLFRPSNPESAAMPLTL